MKLSTDEIIAKSERIAKLVKRYRDLSETDYKTDKEWIAFYEKTSEITNLMREAQDELIEYSKKNRESIQDFLYRITASRLSDDDSDDDKDLLSLNMYSKDIGQRRKFAIITLRKRVGALAAAWDSIIEASSKERYKPYFSTYSSTVTQGLYKALLSPERTTAANANETAIPISKGIRSKDSCIMEWEEGEPSHEAKLLFFYCIAEYRKTKNKIIRIDTKQWKYLRQTERETRYNEIVGEINKLYRASVFINDVAHRLITTGAKKIKQGNTTYIEIGIHDTLADMLSRQKAFMYLNKAMLAIDPKHNPHSIQLLINISSHIGLNKSLSIPTKWLISETALPTEKTVKQKMKRNYLQKIVRPFERDMNAMSSIFEWKYNSGSGSSWKEFNNSSIEISFLDPHPELASIEAKTDGTGRQKDKKPTVPVGKTDGTGRQSNA
ncbi:MAG: hypothetical protein PHT77_12055 [Bacteroidales bacterium]|nr:hypothetical protein [Bacteroidales bacterium]